MEGIRQDRLHTKYRRGLSECQCHRQILRNRTYWTFVNQAFKLVADA
jgi:hypothetical protein